jgi:hypothetical protein
VAFFTPKGNEMPIDNPVNPYDTPNLEEGVTPEKPAKATKARQEKEEVKEEVKPETHKMVIIQRPHGVQDAYVYIGFNNFEGQFLYDTPISLPVEVVDHLRQMRGVEYRPGPEGQPIPSYHNALAVMDA